MFIEKIKFDENFPPFSKDQEIKFGGEEQAQKLIEFYLRSKGNKDAAKNAKRFKINCVLGNNGGGKSRLLNYLTKNDLYQDIPTNIKTGEIYKEVKLVEEEGKNTYCTADGREINCKNIKIERKKLKRFEKEFILDDVFKLSGNISISIHNGLLLSGNFSNNNARMFFFLSKNQDFQNIFKQFLNLESFDNFRLNGKFYINDNHFNENGIIVSGGGGFAFSKEICIGFLTLINNSSDFNFVYYKNFPEKLKFSDKEKMQGLKLLYLYILVYNEIRHISEIANYIGVFKNTYNSLCELQKIISENSVDFFDIGKFDINVLINKFKNKSDNETINISEEQKNLRELLRKYKGSYFEYTIFLNHLPKLKEEKSFKYFLLDRYNDLQGLYTSYFNYDITFDIGRTFNSLSSGEKLVLTRFSNIYIKILEDFRKGKKDFVVLIDEPDLHLHLDWQRQYIQKLIDVFSTLPLDIKVHFIIATHSPFIISDLPKECLVLLENGKQAEYEGKTFGANYIDIIQNGFFFDDKNLMGSFAEEIIGGLANKERERVLENIDYDSHLKENIGDDFLKNNLLYFHKKNEENKHK